MLTLRAFGATDTGPHEGRSAEWGDTQLRYELLEVRIEAPERSRIDAGSDVGYFFFITRSGLSAALRCAAR